MGQITLRNIDPELERYIRRKASEQGKSLNRTILDMLSQNADPELRQVKRPGESLRELAGTWTREDEAEFQAALQWTRRIDEDLWK